MGELSKTVQLSVTMKAAVEEGGELLLSSVNTPGGRGQVRWILKSLKTKSGLIQYLLIF